MDTFLTIVERMYTQYSESIENPRKIDAAIRFGKV